MAPESALTATVVIPTLGRGEVLLQTLDLVRNLVPPPQEVVIIDQTEDHSPEVAARLAGLDRDGAIRWLRQAERSIPKAMNRGLVEARSEIAIFLDDDVVPASDLVARHLEAHARGLGQVIGGQVLQPGEEPEPLLGERFAFRSSVAQSSREVIGCNFSVNVALARRIGGFDERFVGAGYRFEADFCDRAARSGATIYHFPLATLRHLRSPRGGTRQRGGHLTSAWPGHSVGEYYYLLRQRPRRAAIKFLARPLRAVRTRHHFRRPWWILPTLLAEVGGIIWAFSLVCRRPRLLRGATGESGSD